MTVGLTASELVLVEHIVELTLASAFLRGSPASVSQLAKEQWRETDGLVHLLPLVAVFLVVLAAQQRAQPNWIVEHHGVVPDLNFGHFRANKVFKTVSRQVHLPATVA